MANQILKFTPGVSEVIALKFDEGKNCQGKFGPQVQYTTTRGEIFWLDPEPASDVERELANLGISAGQEFRLTMVKTSHGGSRFVVERQQDARRDAGGHNVPERGAAPRYAEPAPMARAVVPEPPPLPSNPITPQSAKLCASMCSMIDAIVEAKAYAVRRGMEFTSEDMRAMCVSAYINECKGGR
jgi:hypothetical protein